MIKKEVRIEPPKTAENGIEFFLQSTPPHSSACMAHIHSSLELLYVREGSYTVVLDSEKYEIKAGDLTLFCSGSIHHVTTEDETQNSYYVIKIPPSFFIEFAKREARVEYVMRFALNRTENKKLWEKEELEGSELKIILDSLVKEYTESRYASEIAIKLKIMELLLAILREGEPNTSLPNDRTAEQIYNVMGYIGEHYAEDIDEKSLALEHGMSYSYFSRSFKRVTGMTFKNYLNRTRINKAEQFLFRNGGSISDAATACGYNSISYFISVYRQITGKTPYNALKQSRK